VLPVEPTRREARYFHARLFVYGMLAFSAACGLGIHYQDRGLIVGALIGIPVVMALVFGASTVRLVSWNERSRSIFRAVLCLALFLKVTLEVWDHMK
jgi:hypothetical protein